MTSPADLDPERFTIHRSSVRGFGQAYVREGVGGVPLVCVHGWPESKRLYWRVIEPLAAAGFEVIVPDLRGFGDSDVAPDGFHDVFAHSADIRALVHDHLGHESVVLMGGDLGGPIIQDLALRYPAWVERMVLFNSPVPWLRDRMGHLRDTRPAREAGDYFVRQGSDPDGLMADLATPSARRAYVATFYTSRGWAHPGAFLDDATAIGRMDRQATVDFHTEPFADAVRLRAGFGAYESTFTDRARSGTALVAHNPHTETLILFGTSDAVISPAFDRMAELAFDRHVGPFLLRDCGHFVPWEAPGPLVSGTRALCRDLLG